MISLYTLGALELLDASGHPVHSAMVQPKRIALLAYLALASPRGFQRRDQVLLIFWPDLTEDRARNALRQAVHHLRHNLGDNVIASRGTEEIGVHSDALWCDAVAMEEAHLRGHDSDAVELYRGPLLNGFHFSGASPEFEQWLDQRRRELARVATAAACCCSESAEAAGDLTVAVRYAEIAYEHSDGDERLLRRVITLHDSNGDGSVALKRYDQFVHQLSRDLGTEPAEATRATVARIRAGRNRAVRPHETFAETATHRTSPVTSRPASASERLAIDLHDASAGPGTGYGVVSRKRFVTQRSIAVAAVVVLSTAMLWLRSKPVDQAGRTHRAASASQVRVPVQNVVALRLYDQGVRALNARDGAAAARLFSAAVDADSTFALAAFSAARADLRDDHTDFLSADKFFRLASRQSHHSSDRDRLMIEEGWADFRNDPARLALAETLAVRYPNDAMGQASLGEARLWSGRFLGALQPLRRAVTLDSSSLGAATESCVACSALWLQVTSLRYADSLVKAEQVARAWTIASPRSPVPWRELASILSVEGRYADARAAYSASAERSHEGSGATAGFIQLAIVSGNLSEADALADADIAGGNDQQRQVARWFKIISLRNEGRLHAAMDVALAYRSSDREQGAWTTHDMYAALPEAQVLLEMGRPREAAALFDSIARDVHRTIVPRLDARNRAWTGTLLAEAVSASRDTAALARLFNSVGQAGTLSAFGRDRLLVNHVYGLMKWSAGDLEGAATSFRHAVFSPSMGYTRTNYDLAQVLLMLHRPGQAIAIIQPALHGVVDASNMYVTRTDLQQVLAQAFDMNAQPDSAIAHYSAVVAALDHADSEFASRRATCRERLRQLSQHDE